MTEDYPTEQDYLLTVCKIVANAEGADKVLFSTFLIISSCHPDVARSIWYSIDSATARRNILRRIADKLCDDEEKTLIGNIISTTKKVDSVRREMVHGIGLFNKSKNYMRHHYPRNPKQPEKPVTWGYINSMIDQTANAAKESMGLYDQLCEKRGLPQQLLL